MKVTNNISMARIGELLKKDFQEKWKSYLLYALCLFGMIFIVEIIWAFMNMNSHTYYNDMFFLYTFGIIGCACIAGSLMFGDISSKENITRVLMTPALPLEKYIARWILFVPIFFTLFYVCGYLGDFIRYLICDIFHNVNNFYFEDNELRNLFTIDKGNNYGRSPFFTTIIALCLQSVFILGSSLWNKNAFRKTLIACFCIWILFLLSSTGIDLFFSKFIQRVHCTTPEEIEAMQRQGVYTTGIICAVITMFFWVLSYFRFKETEIINRW